jgi:hypothetical protein
LPTARAFAAPALTPAEREVVNEVIFRLRRLAD